MEYISFPDISIATVPLIFNQTISTCGSVTSASRAVSQMDAYTANRSVLVHNPLESCATTFGNCTKQASKTKRFRNHHRVFPSTQQLLQQQTLLSARTSRHTANAFFTPAIVCRGHAHACNPSRHLLRQWLITSILIANLTGHCMARPAHLIHSCLFPRPNIKLLYAKQCG